MAPVQGWHVQIENCTKSLSYCSISSNSFHSGAFVWLSTAVIRVGPLHRASCLMCFQERQVKFFWMSRRFVSRKPRGSGALAGRILKELKSSLKISKGRHPIPWCLWLGTHYDNHNPNQRRVWIATNVDRYGVSRAVLYETTWQLQNCRNLPGGSVRILETLLSWLSFSEWNSYCEFCRYFYHFLPYISRKACDIYIFTLYYTSLLEDYGNTLQPTAAIVCGHF